MAPVAPSPVYMALDVGDVRVGVALSRSGVIADPLCTVERNGRSSVLDALQEVVDRERVTVCVIGLPVLESGVEGEQAEKTRAFARSLARRFPKLTLVFRDERYTTAQARELAGRRARGGTNPGGLVDRLAAAVLLQEYLDELATQRKNTPPPQEPGT